MKRIGFELMMYIANYVVNKIPFYTIRKWFYKHIYLMQIGERTFLQLEVQITTRGESPLESIRQ